MVELKDRYDVVVIGAGMGGLTCGGLLARLGYLSPAAYTQKYYAGLLAA